MTKLLILLLMAGAAFAQQHRFLIDSDELPTPCTVPSEAVERATSMVLECVDGAWRDKNEPEPPPTEPGPGASTDYRWSTFFIPCRTAITVTTDEHGTSSEQLMGGGMGSLYEVFCRVCDPPISGSGSTEIEMYREPRREGDTRVAKVSISAGQTTGFTRSFTDGNINEGDIFAFYVTDVTTPAGRGLGCHVQTDKKQTRR